MTSQHGAGTAYAPVGGGGGGSGDPAYSRLQGDNASGSARNLLKDDDGIVVDDLDFPPDARSRPRPARLSGYGPGPGGRARSGCTCAPCAPWLRVCHGLATRAALGWLTPAVWGAFRGGAGRAGGRRARGAQVQPADDSSAFVNESQSSLIDSLRLWQMMRGVGAPSLGRSAWHFCRGRLIIACLLGLVGAAISVITPAVLVSGLIRSMEPVVEDKPVDASKVGEPQGDGGGEGQGERAPAVLWALAFTLCELLGCLVVAAASSISTREAGRLRAALQGLLYRKVLRLNACCEILPHQAESLVLDECGPLWAVCRRAPDLVAAPALMAFSVAAACALVGQPAALAAVVYLMAAATQTCASKLSTRLRKRARAVFSRWRTQRTYELLSLARFTKTFVLEAALVRRIKELRRAEAGPLRLAALLDSASRALLPAAVPAVAVGLALHPALAQTPQLDAQQVFPVLVLLLVHMETALRSWGKAIRALFHARSSLGRLKANLAMEESKPTIGQPIDRLVAVSFNNASFSWAPPASPAAGKHKPGDVRLMIVPPAQEAPVPCVLTAIHIVVNKGRLVGVCGRAGSGKSSLLLAALGQLRLTAGQLHRTEGAAYVGPDPAPLLLPGTVRDNVVVGGALHSQRYYRALHCSGLERDVQALPGGDNTLADAARMTPAQLQRLALARAVYADREIYLLDDPLSALDSASADAIFEATVLGALKGRTIILVTNRQKYLRHCDEVYVLRCGRVQERGAPEDLENSGREFRQVRDAADKEEQWWSVSAPCQSEATLDSERLREEDDEEVGVVGVPGARARAGAWSELTAACSECGVGGWRMSLLALPLALHAVLTAVLALCFWLALRGGGGGAHPRQRPPLLLAGFLLTACALVALAFLRCFVLTHTLLGQSRALHDRWLERMGRATLEFLQRHATALRGALTAHTWLLDAGLPRALAGVATWVPMVVLETALLGVSASWAAGPVLGLLLPGSLVVTYIACVGGSQLWLRERERGEPLRQLVRASSSLGSRAAVLAMGREDDLVARFAKLCDESASHLVRADSVAAWLCVRLRAAVVLAACITLLAQTWPLALALPPGGSVSVGFSALLLMMLAAHLPRAAAAALRARSHLAAVAEARDLVHRAELEDDDMVNADVNEIDPEICWPGETELGGLALRDVWLPTLRGTSTGTSTGPSGDRDRGRSLSARIMPGQCVGVLGPPAGVLGDLLLRFVRPASGCILLSGPDINSLVLPLLRISVVVVPPRPAMFSGTLRWNLDPHGVYSDAQLWEAVERTGIHDVIGGLERKLLTPVRDSESSLTLECVQLLVLTRALLRDTAKVVLLEAPASTRVLAVARALFPHCVILVAGRDAADVEQCENVLST